MATYLDAAGPSRAPALVIHPEDQLPKTWRVVFEWTYRGQRGAWLERVNTGSWHYGRPETPTLAQVVYRSTKRSPRTSTTGSWLKYASRALVCSAWDLYWGNVPNEIDYRAPDGAAAQAEADKAARAEHLGITPDEACVRDKEAVERYAATLYAESLKSDPLGEKRDDSAKIEGWARWALPRARTSGIDVAMAAFDLQFPDGDPARRWGIKIRPMVEARVRAKLGAQPPAPTTTPPASSTTPKPANAEPEPPQRPAGPPPAPGIDRAKWIGERIAVMTARESSDYLPHTRRRIAAHRALSIVAGYSAEDAVNDGLTLPGGFLLHLEGLNAYAARAFAGQED